MKYNIEFKQPNKGLDVEEILIKIEEGIDQFFNWESYPYLNTISFINDGNIRLFRSPTDVIKSGSITVIRNTLEIQFLCETKMPSAYFWGYGLVAMAAFVEYYMGVPFPITLVIGFPVFLLTVNFWLYRRTFKWAMKKLIKFAMINEPT